MSVQSNLVFTGVIMQACSFIVMNLLAGAVATCAADIAMKDREPWKRMVAALAGFPIVVLGTILTLDAIGSITASAAVVLLFVPTALLLVIRWRGGRGTETTFCATGLVSSADETEIFLRRIAVMVMGAFGGVVAIKTCVMGTWLKTDDLSYHAPAVAQWIADSHLSWAPFNYHAYFPFNAEILSLWFMLPFGGDALASLSGLYWSGLGSASIFALAVGLRAPRSVAILLAALFLASPPVTRAACTFAAVDLAGPALILAAAALAAPSICSTTPRRRLCDAMYSGLVAGYAAGCKSSFAVVPVILFLWLCFAQRRTVNARHRLQLALVFAVSAALTGSYWYVRNCVITGNPVFPAEIGIFDGPFSTQDQARTKLVSWLLNAPADPDQWLHILKEHISWPVSLFLIAGAGYCATIYRYLFGGSAAYPANRALGLLLLILGGVLVFTYPLMPFSGTMHGETAPLRINLRFLIAPFAIGLALAPPLAAGNRNLRSLVVSFALLGAMTVWVQAHPAVPLVGVASGAACALLWPTICRLASDMRTRRVITPIGFLAALVAVALWAPYKQSLTNAYVFNFTYKGYALGRAWEALETLPDDASIAWFGPASFQYYPVYGRRLQFNPVAVTPRGLPRVRMHERWKQQPNSWSWWRKYARVSDLKDLVDNLCSTGATHVLVTKGERAAWPPQHGALASSGRADIIYNDGHSAIWRLDDGSDDP